MWPHRQTSEYSATQLVSSIKHKLSHAIFTWVSLKHNFIPEWVVIFSHKKYIFDFPQRTQNKMLLDKWWVALLCIICEIFIEHFQTNDFQRQAEKFKKKTTTNKLKIYISKQVWVTRKAWKDRNTEKRREDQFDGLISLHILHLDCFNSVTRQHCHQFATILIKVKTTVPSLECNFGSCLELESFTSLHCVPSLWGMSN